MMVAATGAATSAAHTQEGVAAKGRCAPRSITSAPYCPVPDSGEALGDMKGPLVADAGHESPDVEASCAAGLADANAPDPGIMRSPTMERGPSMTTAVRLNDRVPCGPE